MRAALYPLCAVLSLAMLLPRAALESARAASGSGIRVDTISHNVRLSLIVPKQVYPQNALVRVTVQVQNLSNHSMDLGATSGRYCPTTSPGVQVIDKIGTIVYPPEVSNYSICTPHPSSAILRPKRVIQRRLLVILRAPYLQAVVTIGKGIESAILPLRLVPGIPPSSIVSNEPSPHIDIHPSPGDRGRLHYFQVTECRTAQSDSVKGSLHWRTSGGARHVVRLHPDCLPATSWHVVAGYVNQPVATIEYRSP